MPEEVCDRACASLLNTTEAMKTPSNCTAGGWQQLNACNSSIGSTKHSSAGALVREELDEERTN